MRVLLPLVLGCAPPPPEDTAAGHDTADTDTGARDTDTDTGDTAEAYAASIRADAVVHSDTDAEVGAPYVSTSLAGEGEWLATGSSIMPLPETGFHLLGDARVVDVSRGIAGVVDVDGDGVDDIVTARTEYDSEYVGDTFFYYSRLVFGVRCGPFRGAGADSSHIRTVETPWAVSTGALATIETANGANAMVVTAYSEPEGSVTETRVFPTGGAWDGGTLIATGPDVWHSASIAGLAGDGAPRLPIADWDSVSVHVGDAFETVEATVQIDGPASDARTAGDLDGDGYEDLLVAVWDAALVFTGPVRSGDTPAVTISSTTPHDGPTQWLGAIDLNGDGRGDLAAGDAHAGAAGRAYVLLGPISGTVSVGDADWHVDGETPDDCFGCTLATDGADRLLVGAGDAIFLFTPTP